MDFHLDGSIIFQGEAAWAARLLSITHGCRPDMHEPNEQELFAQVVGSSANASPEGVCLAGDLDNAMGDDPEGGELTVSLVRDVDFDDDGNPTETRTEHFNLATLVAFARLGAHLVQETERLRILGKVGKSSGVR